jgi:hypothetical protein
VAGPVIDEHHTHSEGRWAGALKLAPPWPMGAILIASGDPPCSNRYEMLVAADRLQLNIKPAVASWLVTTLGRPATA